MTGALPPWLWSTVNDVTIHIWWCNDCAARGDIDAGNHAPAQDHVMGTGHHVIIARTHMITLEGVNVYGQPDHV